jgi:hypothetical protein
MGSGAGNGGDAPVDVDSYDDDPGMRNGSAGRGGGSRALGKLDGIAPLPGMPSLFLPGQIFYRGEVTFRVEILDPNAQNDGGEG